MKKEIALAQWKMAEFSKNADTASVVAASNMLDGLGIEHSLSTSDYLVEISDNPKIMAAILSEFPRNGDDCNTLLSAVRDDAVSFWAIVYRAL